jgi:hypothetical protein
VLAQVHRAGATRAELTLDDVAADALSDEVHGCTSYCYIAAE